MAITVQSILMNIIRLYLNIKIITKIQEIMEKSIDIHILIIGNLYII